MPFSLSELPAGWNRLEDRIPRRNQRVRIVKANGLDLEAQFEVAHTSNWPSGASWRVGGQEATLPFEDVVAWSLNATVPLADAVSGDAPQVYARSLEARILQEVSLDIRQTRQLLQLIPPRFLDWTPKPHVASIRAHARRLVAVVARTQWILDLDEVEDYLEPEVPALEGLPEILRAFDAKAAAVEERVEASMEQDLAAPWRLMRNGHLLVELPRGNALQEFSLTPLAYSRGALALLLSALGVPTPSPDPIWGNRDDTERHTGATHRSSDPGTQS